MGGGQAQSTQGDKAKGNQVGPGPGRPTKKGTGGTKERSRQPLGKKGEEGRGLRIKKQKGPFGAGTEDKVRVTAGTDEDKEDP